MKYRVRLDLSFDKEADAKALMAQVKFLSNKAVSINEGEDNEEIAYCDYVRCYHDEMPTKLCELIEKVEIRKIAPVEIF